MTAAILAMQLHKRWTEVRFVDIFGYLGTVKAVEQAIGVKQAFYAVGK